MNGEAGPKQRLLQVGKIMQQDIPFDYMSVVFNHATTIRNNIISFLRISFDEYLILGAKELAGTLNMGLDELERILVLSKSENKPAFLNYDVLDNMSSQASFESKVRQALRMKSLLLFPATVKDEGDCMFYFFSHRSDTYGTADITLLQHLQQVLVTERGHTPKSTVPAPDKLQTNQNDALPESENAKPLSDHFSGIVGKSHLLLAVFDQIAQVAPFDTSILLLGETGTGKERMAECIHNLSPRKQNALVRVNCASLPAMLIESELFGHEKGSFTGATDKRIGKFSIMPKTLACQKILMRTDIFGFETTALPLDSSA